MPEADIAFVPLADILRAPAVAEADPPAEEDVARASPENARAWEAVARDVRVFRAQLADAFDAARDALLRDLAFGVLGRELLLADADVAAIVARVVAEHSNARPLRVRVAPGDLTRASEHLLLPLIADPALEPGDAIVELSCGSIDARLGVRVAALLERAS